jgi:threonine dehydratase
VVDALAGQACCRPNVGFGRCHAISLAQGAVAGVYGAGICQDAVVADKVTLADIETAASRLDGVVRNLPVHSARWLSDRVGGPAWLATENLQRAGSFKIRGAYNRLSQLTEDERSAGVVAASAGNHAQGVALAASMLGIQSTIFMPRSASMPKVIATRDYGADVRFHGSTLDEAIVEARAFADQTGALFISPFDHPDIVAGQGTLGLEILEQVPDVRTIVVCTGGGGLLAGIALAVASKRPDVRVIGAQAAGAAAYPPSLLAGHPVPLRTMRTMADGIAVGRPGDVPFEIIQRYVSDIRVVSEDMLARAQLLLLERSKLVVEPGGAAAVAAIIDDPNSFETPVVAVLSGGNVDPLVMMRVIRHGLTAGGRFTQITVHVPDRPGSLAGLLAEIGGLDANVVDVSHLRTNPRLAVDEVEITIDLETRGAEHREQLLGHLRDKGYRITEVQ